MQNKKGVVILIAFILLAILGSLSIAFIYLVQSNIGTIKNWILLKQAQFLAESGINLAVSNLIYKIQQNPYLINESEVLMKNFDIDYKKIFSNRGIDVVYSSVSKKSELWRGKLHNFAMFSRSGNEKTYAIKIFIKDASGKINATNLNTNAFKHFLENLTAEKKIEQNINFNALYTEKFPSELRKYFSSYTTVYSLFKYNKTNNVFANNFEKYKRYFKEPFDTELRSFLNINTADEEIIALNLANSNAAYLLLNTCVDKLDTKKVLPIFEKFISVSSNERANTICKELNAPFTKIQKKVAINLEKAKIIANYIVQKRLEKNGWKNYSELFSSIKSDLKNQLTNDEIELFISLIHPKIFLEQLHTYKNIRKTIDKTNISSGGFEFSLVSDGFFEIYSIGIISQGNDILAQETTFKLTKLFSRELIFNYDDLQQKLSKYDSIDFYPYIYSNLPKNALQLDGFVSVAKIDNFCMNDEGRIFKYGLVEPASLEKFGLYDIQNDKYIINPKELNFFVTKEGFYIPPNYALSTKLEKTIDINLFDKQDTTTPFCSPFSSVRPYIYLLNSLGINLLFKNLNEQNFLSFDILDQNTSLTKQVLNINLFSNRLQSWFVDYPLTVDFLQDSFNPTNMLKWNMLSYYYYYKIDQKSQPISPDKKTREKFNIFIRLNNNQPIILPKENEIFINTVFYENLLQADSYLLIGGYLFPFNPGLYLQGVCFYKMPNYYETFSPPYKQKAIVHLNKPQLNYKVITNIYFFGEKITLQDMNELNSIAIKINFVNEEQFPIIDMIEHITFENIQFIESY